MIKNFFSREGADYKLLLAVIISAIFGIFMIKSATASLESGKFVLVQSLALTIGIVAALIITFMDYSLLYKLRYVAMAVGISLLVLVLVFNITK